MLPTFMCFDRQPILETNLFGPYFKDHILNKLPTI